MLSHLPKTAAAPLLNRAAESFAHCLVAPNSIGRNPLEVPTDSVIKRRCGRKVNF
jgi:hypothetical protein